MAQVALAWVLKNPVVAARIVGATKSQHLPDAVAALDLRPSEEEVRTLEQPYTPTRHPRGQVSAVTFVTTGELNVTIIRHSRPGSLASLQGSSAGADLLHDNTQVARRWGDLQAMRSCASATTRSRTAGSPPAAWSVPCR
jgi:hypothetical protein